MISFECDYNNGVHPNILRRLLETNDEQTLGYSFDPYCESAKQKIKDACEDQLADVFFLIGGTQANATVIDSILHTYEGVISVDTGHINTHEAGAIESAGHKIITLPNVNGKMTADALNTYLNEFFADEGYIHCVLPGMVYITFPTELGTLYTAKELDDIYKVCRKHDLQLFIDGARLGYGLAASDGAITLSFLAHHCDAFYIGGTKIGAMFGEAVVFTHANAPKQFFTTQKQHGAVLAKGRFLGLQFDTLFTDNLYMKISQNAIDKGQEMKKIFENKGYTFYIDSPTNQQFVVLDNEKYARLSKKVLFTYWRAADATHTICRFVTSWATTDNDIATLKEIIG